MFANMKSMKYEIVTLFYFKWNIPHVVLVVSHPLENEQALLVASTAAAAAVALTLQVM